MSVRFTVADRALCGGRAALLVGLAVTAAAAAACGRPPAAPSMSLDTLARDYVELALAIGEHDPSYVDAYYGPEPWRAKVKAEKLDLPSLAARAGTLIESLAKLPRTSAAPAAAAAAADAGAMTGLRHDYLLQQGRSAAARIAMLRGTKMRFDEESKALYDAVAPDHDEPYFQAKLDRIAAVLDTLPETPAAPQATLRDRVESLRDRVTIPPAKVSEVFARAIAECRARTAVYIELPAGESFTVESVTDKSWSAYNWYQGGYESVIQVNVSLPIWIDRAIDLACHEGYPGHHVYNLLLEQKLVKERGWPEYQVYALFSPQSLIAEGTANFGIELAFPRDERLGFERDVLFPLAGLDPALADPYARVTALVRELSYASNEAARRYLDGEIDALAAAAWLERFGLYSPERAAQRVRFIDTYRSYVINYNLGEDLVRRYVDRRSASSPEDPPTAAALAAADGVARRRWQVFTELLSSPRLPSALSTP